MEVMEIEVEEMKYKKKNKKQATVGPRGLSGWLRIDCRYLLFFIVGLHVESSLCIIKL